MRFRLLGILLHCTLLSTVAHGKLVFDWVTVGNAGNGADVTGHGAVDYTYRISKHEVTNGQYTQGDCAIIGKLA